MFWNACFRRIFFDVKQSVKELHLPVASYYLLCDITGNFLNGLNNYCVIIFLFLFSS